MDLSSLPKDILELGSLLVSEYLEERDVDTLSRWFLHAIAERLVEFDKAKGQKTRKSAQDAAADLILRFWRHRKATNLNVDPLSRFEELFKSLELLLPKSNPWLWQRTSKTEKLAAEIFDCLSSLTVGFMLLSLTKPDGEPGKRHLFTRFLPTNEQGVVGYFNFVARDLTKTDSPDGSESVSLESMTVIETVREWTLLARTKLDEVDRVLNEAATKLPEKAGAFKKKVAKKASPKSSKKKAAKKKSTAIKKRAL
jgi:hypothetical protein